MSTSASPANHTCKPESHHNANAANSPNEFTTQPWHLSAQAAEVPEQPCEGENQQSESANQPTRPQAMVGYADPNKIRELSYENSFDYNWEEALCSFEQYISGSAESDPMWASVSEFDYPGAPKTFNLVGRAIPHIKLGEEWSSGRLQRKAFSALADEIRQANPDFIQGICLNVVGVLARYCARLFAINPARLQQYHIFLELSRMIGQSNPKPTYYFRQLSEHCAIRLLQPTASPARSNLQAQRRFYQIVRDSTPAAADEAIDNMDDIYGSLLCLRPLSMGIGATSRHILGTTDIEHPSLSGHLRE